jgi:acetylornithine deacetylase/succinyl-diaminopimelate desuccinylase-like protein
MADPVRLEATLVRLLQTPTGVPPGQTEIAPGDPAVTAAVADVIRPLVEELRPERIDVDADGNLVARFGPEPDAGALLLVYVVSQHAHEMAEPYAGRIVDGAPYGLAGRSVLGQGATQNKGPMAAVLEALRDLAGLRTGVTLAVNSEGRSSHGGSKALIDRLGARGAWGLVATGTDLRVPVGNRGRVDVRIEVLGDSAHSSQPWLGANPIPIAAEVVGRLDALGLPQPHPDLGTASVTPYQLRCDPVAPHTIPRRVEVVVDRRLLPGEDPHAAVVAIRAALPTAKGLEVRADAGALMWPALVDPSHPAVQALVRGVQAAGRNSGTFYSLNTFDAGYPCRAGIPTVMFGPGRRRFGGDGLLADDVVAVDDCVVAADAIRNAILDWDGHASA